MDRYMISATARRRRRVIDAVEHLMIFAGGALLYAITGLVLRWVGVA